MELNNNELSEPSNSLDLLSAALNESGVTLQNDLDINANSDNKDILASLMTTIQPGQNDDRSESPVLKKEIKAKPIQIKNVQKSCPKIITVGRSGVHSPVPMGKIIKLSKQQPKIIKMPMPEPGKGNLPRIIKIPLNSKMNNNNLPILISKRPNSVGAQSVPTVITTNGIKCKTVGGLNSTVIRFQNNNNIISRLNISNFEKSGPIKNKQSSAVPKLHQPRINNFVNNNAPQGAPMTSSTGTVIQTRPLVQKEKGNFNLGSMFVESAEKSGLDEYGLSPSPESLTEMPNFEELMAVPTARPIKQTIIGTRIVNYPTALYRQQSVPAKLSDRAFTNISNNSINKNVHPALVRTSNTPNHQTKQFPRQNIPHTSDLLNASLKRNSPSPVSVNKSTKNDQNKSYGVTEKLVH